MNRRLLMSGYKWSDMEQKQQEWREGLIERMVMKDLAEIKWKSYKFLKRYKMKNRVLFGIFYFINHSLFPLPLLSGIINLFLTVQSQHPFSLSLVSLTNPSNTHLILPFSTSLQLHYLTSHLIPLKQIQTPDYFKICQQQLENPMAHFEDSTIKIGNYSLENTCLGEGTYGKVFRSKNLETNQTVAIKIVDMQPKHPQINSDIFQNEVRCLKMLKNCQNIVQLEQSFRHQNKCLLILEYCQEGDLFEMIVRDRPCKKKLRNLMQQIIKGYQEIRRKKIIHRDLKPSNILVCQRGKSVKICDFGFAIDEEQVKKYRNVRVGSNFHMAPEVIRKNIYSEGSDIWALGVIYFEMLTGRYLWVGRNIKQLYSSMENNPIEAFLTQDMDQIDKKFLKQCLKMNRNERASPEDLLHILCDQSSRQKTPEKSSMLTVPKNFRSINKELQTILYLSRLEFYLIKLISFLSQKIPELSEIMHQTQLTHLLFIEAQGRIDKLKVLEHLTSLEKQEFSKSDYYFKFLTSIQQLQSKTNKFYQRHTSDLTGSVDSINDTLRWLHKNVNESSPYYLFILYDYLITYRWLWGERYSVREQKRESLKWILNMQLDLGAILNSLKRELQRQKRVSHTNLSKLSFKLKKLQIISV